MLHFVTSYMKQNKSRKKFVESVQNRLEISFKVDASFRLRKLFAFQNRLSTNKDLSTFLCQMEVIVYITIIQYVLMK